MLKRKSKILTVIFLLVISLSCNFINNLTVVHANMSVQEVLDKYKKEIIASSRKTGVWASVTAAQLVLESGNPVSDLAQIDNNLFGIKWATAHGERYPGATPVEYLTSEYVNGSPVSVYAKFTHFPSISDSITEHSIIWWNGYYENELQCLEDFSSTRDDFITIMGNGNYATSTTYESQIRAVVKDWNLAELDELAFPDGRKFTGFGDRSKGEYKYPNDGYNSEDVKNAGTTTGTGKDGYVIVKEDELVGMYPDTFFKDFSKSISLSDGSSLSTAENLNISTIKGYLEDNNAWKVVNTARGGVIFVGLFMLVYAVLLWVCWMFDRSNNLFDVSLVQVATFGNLEYSDEDDGLHKGKVNKARLVRVEIALFLCGFFIVTGAFFSFLFDIYLSIGLF